MGQLAVCEAHRLEDTAREATQRATKENLIDFLFVS